MSGDMTEDVTRLRDTVSVRHVRRNECYAHNQILSTCEVGNYASIKQRKA